MASGKKNYFRHNFNASEDPKIVGLIDDYGKEAYFHYFRIVELCASEASDEFPVDSKFTFRRSTLCRELRVTNSRLTHHLLAIHSSLLGEVLVTEKEVQILLPNLVKYMGKYETKLPSNVSNKRKEKEIKEKEIKTAVGKSDELEIVSSRKKVNKFDIESIYAMYPKKEGKKKGLDKLKREIKTYEKFTQLEAAVKNYSIKHRGTDSQYIKQFSTFAGCWEDYIEPEKKEMKDFSEDDALNYFEEKMKDA